MEGKRKYRKKMWHRIDEQSARARKVEQRFEAKKLNSNEASIEGQLQQSINHLSERVDKL